MRAWLVTWDAAGAAAEVADRVAAIWPWRWSAARVAQMIEALYALHAYDPVELANFAKKPRANPYQAHSEAGLIVCGHNPFLVGRTVTDLAVSTNEATGLDTITWVELPCYSFNPDVDPRPKVVKGPMRVTTTRNMSGPLSSEEIWDRSEGRYKVGFLPMPQLATSAAIHLPSSKRRRTTR